MLILTSDLLACTALQMAAVVVNLQEINA